MLLLLMVSPVFGEDATPVPDTGTEALYAASGCGEGHPATTGSYSYIFPLEGARSPNAAVTDWLSNEPAFDVDPTVVDEAVADAWIKPRGMDVLLPGVTLHLMELEDGSFLVSGFLTCGV